MTATWALLLGALAILATAEGVILYFVIWAVFDLVHRADEREKASESGAALIRSTMDRADALNARVIALEHRSHTDDGPSILAKVDALLPRAQALESSARVLGELLHRIDERFDGGAAGLSAAADRITKIEEKLEQEALGATFGRSG